VAAVALAATSVGVRIVGSSLVGAADVSITAPIRSTFSQAIEPASVEAHFRIEPTVDGELQWQGRDLVFQPQTALAPETS
jgi:hypothetical protein